MTCPSFNSPRADTHFPALPTRGRCNSHSKPTSIPRAGTQLPWLNPEGTPGPQSPQQSHSLSHSPSPSIPLPGTRPSLFQLQFPHVETDFLVWDIPWACALRTRRWQDGDQSSVRDGTLLSILQISVSMPHPHEALPTSLGVDASPTSHHNTISSLVHVCIMLLMWAF